MKIAFLIKRKYKPTTLTFSKLKALKYSKQKDTEIEKIKMIPDVTGWSET